ncbi:MAG TPA: flagellar hook-length control protein FliK [Rhodocyclaceae bacterium]|nr:flagellar hook-length control protein FliK [Rhodocyclaceae bacterium]
MALIPPDIGLRLRTPADGPLQPLAPAAGVPSDLPELTAGQAFTARIQEILPENTYRALVAGKSVTLALPEGAEPGDTLELVLVDKTPRLLLARLADGTAAAAASAPYPHATLSAGGRLIARLLPGEGEPPAAALLNRGQALLSQAPAGQAAAAQLAPALAGAVERSGLFYEAHQAQWLAGNLPTTRLLDEPQGRHSPLVGARPAESQAAAPGPESAPRAVATVAREAGGPAAGVGDDATKAAQATLATIPEDLKPLVQQQLDAGATQRLLWHGEVWPGQPMDWEIVRGDGTGTADTPEQEAWSTRLHLEFPRLGIVDATLRLTAGGLAVVIATPYGASAADLRQDAPALANAMEAAGLPAPGVLVQHENEPG